MNACITCGFVGEGLCPDHGDELTDDQKTIEELWWTLVCKQTALEDELEAAEGDPVVAARLEGFNEAMLPVSIAYSLIPAVARRLDAWRAKERAKRGEAA